MKKGHLTRVCKNNLASKPEQVCNKSKKANVIVGDEKQDVEESSTLVMDCPRFSKIVIEVNGNQPTMEIDKGASVSVISEEALNVVEKRMDTMKLQKSPLQHNCLFVFT